MFVSDYDYVLEFAKPSTLVFDNNVVHWMNALSICTWVKVPPNLKSTYNLVNFRDRSSLVVELAFRLDDDQTSYSVRHDNVLRW